jgi:hypothetical protein
VEGILTAQYSQFSIDDYSRAPSAADSRVGSRLPPTVAWKNGGSGLMFCDRAAP